MAKLVVSNAVLSCSFGATPSVFTVLPVKMVNATSPAANIMDHIPMVNIKPFGMCSAPTNPAVIAALGSPVPCVPVTPAPWAPGSPTVPIKNQPALNDSSKCMCTWLGIIGVTNPGQTITSVP